MTLLAKYAKVASIHGLCLVALGVIAAPVAAQVGRVVPLGPRSRARAPVEVPATLVQSDRADRRERSTSATPAAGRRQEYPRRPARFQLSAGLFGSTYFIDCGVACGVYPVGNRASSYLGVRYFLTPVIDEDAPRSLQPFLQRTSSVRGHVSGGGFLTTAGLASRTYSYVAASAGFDVYLTPRVALTGGVGYAYDVLRDAPTLDRGHSLSGDAGLALRFGDVRIDASYGFDAHDIDGDFTRLRWGTVALSAYLVIARSYVLAFAGHLTDGGGGGHVELGQYTNKDFGFFVGGSARTFRYTASETRANRYTASTRIEYWVGPSTLFECEYEFRYEEAPLEPPRTYASLQYEHALSLSLLVQLP